MLDRYTLKFHADVYINAAKKLGLQVNIIDKKYGVFELSDGQKTLRFKNTSFETNNMVATYISLNKKITGDLLRAKGIPVPTQHVFGTKKEPVKPEEFAELAKAAQPLYPVVLKPLKGGGGRGVYVNIKTESELKQCFDTLLSQKVNAVLLENYLEGDDYRVLIYGGKVLDVLKRIPAYVTGDGISTIDALIKRKNDFRSSIGLATIIRNEKLDHYLSLHELSLETIPEEGQHIQLIDNCNFSQGGEVKRIPLDSIHTDTMQLFVDIATETKLTMCALDVITKDITTSPSEDAKYVNETNSSPGIDIHYFADNKPSLEMTKTILTQEFNC